MKWTTELLIEPVWNRNVRIIGDDVPSNTLLIEPVWNRNLNETLEEFLRRHPFNRTSMESKLAPAARSEFEYRITFNRTSMESKPGNPFTDCVKRFDF